MSAFYCWLTHCTFILFSYYYFIPCMQIIVVNMTDPDDLRRHHFADYLTAAVPLPRTAQEKFHHATR